MTNYRKMVMLLGTSVMLGTAGAQPVTLPSRGLCAHRGDVAHSPENTMPALQHAIDGGAQMIEFDIQLSKDSVLVIMHDATVDRTTNGRGAVADLSFAELRKLDAGVKKNVSFTGTRIPSFEEVLDMMPANIWLNCHLKGDAAVGKAAAEMVQRKGRMAQAFLACGEEAAAAARAVVPSILICNAENRYRTDDAAYVKATVDMKAPFIQLVVTRDSVSRAPLVKLLRDHQVRINYFMANDPSELGYLFDHGIDFVLVNDLGQFKQAASLLGIEPVKPEFTNTIHHSQEN